MLFWWSLILLVYYTNGFEKCLTTNGEVMPKKYFHLDGRTLDINLETSSRITHQLSTHVFYIYIDEILGYNSSKIKINMYEDNFQIESVIERLSDHILRIGIFPPATINLEVWISTDYDTFSKELVKECGSIAPPGRFGWFIPLQLNGPVQMYYKYSPNPSVQEVHWSFFLDRNLVKYFDMDQSTLLYIERNGYNMENGSYICNSVVNCTRSMYIPPQCRNQPCAVLLAPKYRESSFLINQIEETGLLVKILWLGNNLKQAFMDLKSRRLHSDNSILIFNWFPSDIIRHEKLFISVQFKNNELYNFTKSIGYKYEMHRLVKLAWNKVQENANLLYMGLRNFKFSEEDYNLLLSLYDNKSSNQTIREVACQWMKSRPQTWNEWKVKIDVPIINIGGIFPITHSSYNGAGIMAASRMAVDAINRMKFLPDYSLRLVVTDGKCSADTVMKNFIDFIVTKDYYNSLVGVLGPACSETVEPIAGVSKHYHIMVISYSAEGASFSDRKKYPYFFRTIGENQHYKHVYIYLFEKFNWKRVAALTEDGQKYTEYISLMQDDFESHNIKFIANKKFPREKKSEDMKMYLEDLKNRQARIIIADVVDDAARIVMCEAYKLDMTARQGYVWFLPVWLNKTWYDTDTYNKLYNNSDNKFAIINCTTKEMIEAITGYFSMTHAYYAPDDNKMQENITVGEWKKNYQRKLNNLGRNTSDYGGFAYDAVWTYAFALKELAKDDPEAMTNLHSEKTINKLVDLVKKTDFSGVSGRIKFRGGPSRFSVINIMQWYDNVSHIIGNFTPRLLDDRPIILDGNLSLNEPLIQWFTKNKRRPEDGTLPQPTCAVASLAQAFGVECQTAMIILNVMVAGTLLIGVVVVCYYMKRKYDTKMKRVEEEKKYIRSLGFSFEMNSRDLVKWEITRECVVINRKLGEGAFGTVYGGEVNLPKLGWTAVAVKTLKVGSTAEEKLDFLSEAEAMKRFEHKNIVKLLGVCTKEEPVYTIMEFMLYGDLKTYLLGRRHLVKNKNIDESEEVSPKRLTNMALDVARGLSYLAEMKFIHRDIACRNCLVNAQRNVKIGDFGMTRAMFDNDYYKFTRKGMLPVRWMSPESLALGVFTPASDVWSYGVLLYEIITFGSFPFQGKSNIQVLEMVKEGQTLEIPKGAKPLLVALIKSCWKIESKERPTASQMVEFLANNPRLLAPCLDVPLSSVQIEDQEHIDMTPSDGLKLSPSKSINGLTFHVPATIFEDKFETESDSIPMEVCCSKQPLLGQAKSNSNLLSITKLMGASREESDEEDEYRVQGPSQQENTNV